MSIDRGSPNLPGIPGSEPEPPRSRTRLWVELVAASALVVLLGLLVIGYVTNAVGAHRHGGASPLGQAVLAVVCFGLLVLSSRWAIRIEHRLRRHQPVARAFEAASAASAPKTRPERPGRRPRRHYGPVTTGVITGLFAVGTIALVVGAISSYSQGARSGFVQAHGTRASATVQSVDNTEHCSRSGCSYTAAIAVTLSPPVDGAAATTVHYPGYSDLIPNEQVIVLVDPQQPGYAELPGDRFVTSWEWIILAAAAIFVAFLTAVDARAFVRLIAHRRDHLAQPGSPQREPEGAAAS